MRFAHTGLIIEKLKIALRWRFRQGPTTWEARGLVGVFIRPTPWDVIPRLRKKASITNCFSLENVLNLATMCKDSEWWIIIFIILVKGQHTSSNIKFVILIDLLNKIIAWYGKLITMNHINRPTDWLLGADQRKPCTTYGFVFSVNGGWR